MVNPTAILENLIRLKTLNDIKGGGRDETDLYNLADHYAGVQLFVIDKYSVN